MDKESKENITQSVNLQQNIQAERVPCYPKASHQS